jgi:hypothetical protein
MEEEQELKRTVCKEAPEWTGLFLGLLGFGAVLYHLYCKLKMWRMKRKLRSQLGTESSMV